MIPKFYAGNVVLEHFPLSKVVSYFQFGIISSKVINNAEWQVYVKEPRMLRQTGWTIVDKAWTIQGDRSYLDNSLLWGGKTYSGVEMRNDSYPILKPYEAISNTQATSKPPEKSSGTCQTTTIHPQPTPHKANN